MKFAWDTVAFGSLKKFIWAMSSPLRIVAWKGSKEFDSVSIMPFEKVIRRTSLQRWCLQVKQVDEKGFFVLSFKTCMGSSEKLQWMWFIEAK